jgi:Leucine-rich repeat (LRR) protein
MNFPALEELNLTRNPKIDFADLFKKLSSVKTLKYLDISENKLTTLPKEIGLLTSLEYLVIGQNAISALPEEFFNLANLKILNVYGSYGYKISETELQKIKEKLPNCEIIEEWVYRN